MKFNQETAKKARALWGQKYDGSLQHRWWASQGYWTTLQKYGAKTCNKICYGEHLSRAEALRRREADRDG